MLQVRFDKDNQLHMCAIRVLSDYCAKVMWYFVVVDEERFVFRKGDYTKPADLWSWNMVKGVLWEADLSVEGAMLNDD